MAVGEHERLLYCYLSQVQVVAGGFGHAGPGVCVFEVQVGGRAVDPAIWLAGKTPLRA